MPTKNGELGNMKIRNTVIKSVLMSTISITSMGYASTAIAQESAVDEDEEEDDSNVIIVTASKRETTLQELPVSVSVTSAATIEQAQIRDLLDLQTVAPSLTVSQNQSSSNATFIIRGFGNGANNVGVEPSVGVFIDGVFRSRSAGQIGDLANVARVEVLRGPQSTLFGKNASAGVISVVTREPQYEFGGNISATYGNFNQVVIKGDVTGPIGDNLAFSVDGSYNRRDGFFDIVNLGEEINNRDRYSIRGQLLAEPTDNLKFRLIGDFSRIDESCCFAGNLVAGPSVPAIFAVGGAIDPENVFGGNAFLNIEPINEIESYGVSLQTDYTAGALTFTNITAYRRLSAFEQTDVDFSSADVVNELADQSIETFTTEFRVSSDFDGPFNFLLGGFYFNENIAEESQLITGQDTRNFFSLLAGDPPANVLGGAGPTTFDGVEAALGIPSGGIFAPGLLTDESFTFGNESFSIFGTLDFEVTDRLTLSAGFNYTDDSKDFAINFNALDPLANINLVDAVIVGQIAGATMTPPGQIDAAAIGAFAAANPAAFGAIAAAATDPAQNPLLGLQAFQFQPPFVNVPNSVEDGRTGDTDLSYTLRASYEFTDQLNAYFTYATGFKASSVNLSRDSRPSPTDFTPGPFGSTILAPPSNILNAGLAVPNLGTGGRVAGREDAEVFEAGIKGQFDRVGFNLAIFDQTLDGFQSNIFTGTGFALTNAGQQSTFGFEFDTTVRPVDPLVLTFAITYLDPQFDSFVGSPVGDLSGEEVGGVSPISLATSATYTHEFGSGASLIARADYNLESGVNVNNGLPTFNTALGNTELFQREVNLINASLTLQLTNGIEISAFARNLLDEQFITTNFDGVAQAGTVSAYPNDPRTYGGTIRFRF